MPSHTDTTPSLRIDIEARPELLCVLRSGLSTWCLRAGLTATRTDAACLAVDEAAANIIRHAYERQPGRIRLSCTAEQTHFLLELEDDGRQVPLDSISPRPLDDVRPGGLGVHLIRQVMDEATWSHRPAGGTLLTMRLAIETVQPHRPSEEMVHVC